MPPEPSPPWPLAPIPPGELPPASPAARVAGLFALGAGCGLLLGGGSLFALLAGGCRSGGGASSSRVGIVVGVAPPASPATPFGPALLPAGPEEPDLFATPPAPGEERATDVR